MKIKSTTRETRARFGIFTTKVGILSLGLIAAPVAGMAAYGATSSLEWENSPCVVASLKNEPSIFASRGNCTPSDLPTSGSTPESPGADGSTPTETSPPTTAERASLTNVELYGTGTKEIILLNDGGFIEVVADKQVFITPTRGAAAREIVGYPAGFTVDWRRLDANASPDGQTIVIYNQQHASVSFDGGATWSPQRQADQYTSGHSYLSSAVSADGKVVILGQGPNSGTGSLSWLNSDSGRQLSDWKTTWTNEYSLEISADGTKLITSVYAAGAPKQTRIDLAATPYPSRVAANLYSYTWLGGFAASGDMQLQTTAIRDQADSVNYLFTSKDGGSTMTKKMAGTFWSMGVSNNGVIQAGVRTHLPENETGKIYMSFDSGENWKKMDVLNGAVINGASLAPDGKTLRITTDDSKVYFATINP